MSTTIDQQVVEMRFDNKHFEQNVSTTMSTLDKFKQKLNMSDAAKGLDNVNAAAKNVNLNPLGSAVETVGAKFSALQVMGVTALANITNSAINAGKQIVKSLTIDPVTTGFNEYELKMGSIQTIMAGTGESLDTVNRYLNELNKYSDDTIYSFKDMTSNIGKFTNAGVSLEDAVLAIKGISNEAALSGANANEASRAMYNFSQALSAGFVKLIDWKSIELANMATKEFKEQLIKTAVEVGTLKEGADGMYDVVNVVSKANAVSLNATKNFNDSLGNQWMTTEVLIETLRDYADGTTEIGKRATAAATEVKTFTMMMDTLKEAAQSGWAQTWELSVGDFEEAKAFYTELSDIFGGIIGDSADRRNAFFGEALTSNWDKLLDKLEKAGVKAEDFEEAIRKQSGSETHIDSLVKKYGSLGKAIQDGAIATEILQKALDSIFDTKANKTVEAFVDGLKEVKRILGYWSIGDDVKKVQTALDALGYDLGVPGIDGIIGPITTAAIKAFQKDANIEIDGIVGPETLAALEAAGTKVNELEGDVDDLKSSCKDLIKVITQKSGRELLLGSLLNIIKAIRKPLSAVGKAFGNIFTIKPTHLYNLIEGFNKFTSLLVINDETAKKLQRTFEGLFSALKIVTTIAGGALGTAFKVLMVILEKFDIGFLDLTANIGDALVNISKFINDGITKGIGAAVDWLLPKITAVIEALKKWVESLKETKLGKGAIDAFKNWPDTLEKISKAFTDSIDAIKGWFAELKNTQLYKDVSGWFVNLGEDISNAITNIKNSITNIDIGGISDRFQGIRDFFSNLYESLKQNEIVISIIDGIKSAFNKVKEFFGKFKLPEFNIDNLNLFSKYMSTFESSGKSGIGNMFKSFGEHWVGLRKFDWQVFKENLVTKFVDFYFKMGDKIKEAFEKCKEVLTAIKIFIFGADKVDLPMIMDAIKKILEIMVLIQALVALKKIVAPLDNVSSALNNLATSLKWDAIAGMFKSMAIAMAVLTVCLIVISQIPAKEAIRSAVILGSLIVVLGAVVSAMAFFAGKVKGGIDMAGAVASLLMLVGSIAILVYTLKEIDDLKLKNPASTFLILGGILVALTAGVKMISKAGGSSFRSVAAILTLMAALKLILEVLESYDKYDWTGKSDAILRMVQMLIILSVAINLASRGIKSGASASGLAFTILAMVISLKLILSAIKEFAATPVEELKKGGVVVAAIFGFMTAMMVVANLTSKETVLERGQKSVNNFAGFAVALLAVVGAIWLLGKMDIATLKQGGLAVAGVLLLFTGMLAVIGKTCSGLKMGVIITVLVGLAVIIAEVAIIMHKLKDIPWQNSVSTVGAMSAVILAMAFALKTLTKYDVYSGNIWHWVLAMAALGAIMVGLAFTLKAVKDVHPETAVGVATALGIMISAMAAALLSLTKYDVSSGNIWKWIPAMAALAVIMVGLSHVLKNAKDVSAGNAIGVATGLSVMLLAIAGVFWILDKAPMSGTQMAKWVAAFLGFAVVIGAISEVLKGMKDLDPQSSIGNATALSELLIVLAGVMTVVTAMSKFAKPAGMTAGLAGIAALGLVIWELGWILNAMKTYDLGSMWDDMLVLSGLMVVLTDVLAACTGLGTILAGGGFLPALGLLAALAGLAALGLIVWELGGIMHAMIDFNLAGMADDVVVLGALLVLLTGILGALSVIGLLGATAAASITCLALLGLVVWELGAILNAMSDYKIAEMEPAVKTLASLLMVMTAVLAPLSVIGLLGTTAISGVIGLAALGLVVWELGAILNAMRDYNLGEMMPDVKTLSVLLVTLAGIMPVLALVGVFAPAMAAGVLGLAALGLVIWELGAIINAMKSYDLGTAMPMVAALVLLVAGLTEVLVKLALVGPMAAIGVIALQGLLLVITELAVFVGAVGLLMDKVPSLETFLDKGIGVFVKLAGGLGEIIGAFVGGSVRHIMESLNELAIGLSSFAENITDFVDAMAGIDPNIATGVDALCGAIIAITGANLLDAITGWLGGKDLSEFGASISDFAVCIKDAAGTLKDITDDDVANIERSAKAGVALADLANAIPRSGGVWQEWAGERNLSDFGQTLIDFGECIVEYSKSVSGEDFNAEAIKTSAEAGKALAEVANAIPASGGKWQEWVAGEKNLSEFGKTLVDFGSCLKDYNAIVTDATFNPDAISSSAEAGKALAEVANAIPSAGGAWQEWITGERNLADFGKQLITFGKGVLSYSEVAVQITDDKIAAITKSGAAIDAIKTVMEKIPEKANWWDNLTGTNQDAGTWGDGVKSVAIGIRNYCAIAADLTEDKIAAINNSGVAIDAIKTVLTKVPEKETADKAFALHYAVQELQFMAQDINDMSLAAYDYTAIDSLTTAMQKLPKISAGLDIETMVSEYSDIRLVITDIKNIAKKLGEVSNHDYSGVESFKSAINSLAETDTSGMVKAFSGKVEDMKKAVETLINTMTTAIDNKGDVLAAKMESVMYAAINGARHSRVITEIGKVGTELVNNLTKAIDKKQSSVKTSGELLGTKAAEGAKAKRLSMYTAGTYLGSGLVSGINDMASEVYWAAYALGAKAVQGEKDGQASNSPSKLTIQAGKWLGEGLVIGMTRMSSSVYNAGRDLGKAATGSLSSTISRISDAINTDIDAQPTIRPVLDLSDVRAGAGMIGNLLGGEASVGVLSNVSGISSMMNRRSQNGSNAEVVSAIKDLRRDLANVGNTSYHIDGVTYDDGSNIADAVKTIARAVKMERRV